MSAKLDDPKESARDLRCRVLVAGVGGGACSVLGHALAGWAEPPTVAAINTDARALGASNVDLKVAIGRTVAKGMGTGGDAELGRLAANEDLDALRALVSGHDLLLLVASLGGGTGTGAAPVLARIAREEGLLVLAYVTLPFAFEGARRQEQAQEGLADLKPFADAVVCLPNQRLHAMLPPDTSLGLLEGPMLEKGRVIANSGAMILSVTGGPDLSLVELETIHRRFQEAARPGARISMGAAVLDGWTGRLVLTVLAAEHWMPPPRSAADPSKPGGSLFFDEAPPKKEEARPGHAGKGAQQSELPLGSVSDRGRFQDVAPTIHDGADLDIPVFIRRGIRLPT